ncbi:hypothetical protein CRG98_009482 [Punica granatum]|nr:hypothetical protein CRG98_009482 [Punica granatum]
MDFELQSIEGPRGLGSGKGIESKTERERGYDLGYDFRVRRVPNREDALDFRREGEGGIRVTRGVTIWEFCLLGLNLKPGLPKFDLSALVESVHCAVCYVDTPLRG